MWVSWASTDSSSAKDETVTYGTSPGALTNTVTGQTVTYEFSVGAYTSPYLHHALLTGLEPGTQYFYRVGGKCGQSALANFTTSPGPSERMTFAVMGDLGQTSNSADTLAHIVSNPEVDTIMHIGDLSYADSDEPRWDSWGALIDYASCRIPWNTIVGNHEVESNSKDGSFKAYSSRFWTPAVQARGPANGTWYSLELGMVHCALGAVERGSYSVLRLSLREGGVLRRERIAGRVVLTPCSLHLPDAAYTCRDLRLGLRGLLGRLAAVRVAHGGPRVGRPLHHAVARRDVPRAVHELQLGAFGCSCVWLGGGPV